jgi:hypothetical protein
MGGTVLGMDAVTVGLACLAVAGAGIGASVVMLIRSRQGRRSARAASRNGHRAT